MGYDHDTITGLDSEYQQRKLIKALELRHRLEKIAQLTGFDYWDLTLGRVNEDAVIDKLMELVARRAFPKESHETA
jgi:hypothetical protein